MTLMLLDVEIQRLGLEVDHELSLVSDELDVSP
jgi:hypothetical protein